ncbi:MAG: fluoride efflux transporter CrcB [Deltaproteobacteria bacterium]|nr:MAG: fluoride efflux transporter CrcB [Deltaproteobacteria bacterium]
MGSIIAVILGGGFGALVRYGFNVGVERSIAPNYPLATLAVNLLGCLIIGFCWACFERIHITHTFRIFLFTGFFGGFTTFSAYAREGAELLSSGEVFQGLSYILVSNIAGILMVFFGIYLCNLFFRFIRV